MGDDDANLPDFPPLPPPARAGGLAPPTPVRASLADENAKGAPVPAAAAEVVLEVDGVSWTVTLAGMTRSGAGSASATILLLRFHSGDPGDGGGKEAWVVGRSLADLTDLQLESAFRRSDPVPEAWARKTLFPEAGSRSGKDG